MIMLYINGEWTHSDSKQMFSVYNPATGESLGEVANGKKNDTLRAIEAATEVFETWSQTTAYERAELLYKTYELMIERKEAIAELMTKEQGKPLRAALIEVQYGADFLRWFAEEAKRVY